MVCLEAPCVCNKTRAKPKAQQSAPVKQARSEPTANNTPPPTVLKRPVAPSVLGSRAPLTEPTTTTVRPGSRHKPAQARPEQPSALKNESEDEALMNDRIRLLNMMGMLHPSEVSKHETIIKSIPLAPIINSQPE